MTTGTSTPLDVARAYWDASLAPLPRVTGYVELSYIDDAGEIYSILWGEYKIKQPDWATVQRWFAQSDPATVGVIVLTGTHAHPRADYAAYLQILDIETPERFEAFTEQFHFLGHSAILHRCVIERTPSNGGHMGFLCRTIGSKQKLTLARCADNKLLIELLEHQPCTIAPTTIRCKPEHPDGACYDRQSLPSTTALSQVVEALIAQAQYDELLCEVYTRTAYVNDKLYLDLANDRWNVVEVDADGWRVLDKSPVYFRRTSGMLPLPIVTTIILFQKEWVTR